MWSGPGTSLHKRTCLLKKKRELLAQKKRQTFPTRPICAGFSLLMCAGIPQVPVSPCMTGTRATTSSQTAIGFLPAPVLYLLLGAGTV